MAVGSARVKVTVSPAESWQKDWGLVKEPRFQKAVKASEYGIRSRKLPLPAYRLGTYFYY